LRTRSVSKLSEIDYLLESPMIALGLSALA